MAAVRRGPQDGSRMGCLLLRAGIAVTYSPQSPRRTQRLFWVVIHPNHLCALGGLGGEYFPRPPIDAPPCVFTVVTRVGVP